VLGDRAVGLAGLGLGELQRLAVGLDQDVDLVDVEGVTVVREDPERPGELHRGLDDQQPLGIGACPPAFPGRRARVKGEAAPALGVGRAGRGRHHPRALRLEDRLEAAEVGRSEADVRSLVAQRALHRAEEAREEVNPGVGEELAPNRQQAAADAQLLPVLALAHGLEQGAGLAGPERDAERVGGLEARRGFGC
jgi:hypothetical protein